MHASGPGRKLGPHKELPWGGSDGPRHSPSPLSAQGVQLETQDDGTILQSGGMRCDRSFIDLAGTLGPSS